LPAEHEGSDGKEGCSSGSLSIDRVGNFFSAYLFLVSEKPSTLKLLPKVGTIGSYLCRYKSI